MTTPTGVFVRLYNGELSDKQVSNMVIAMNEAKNKGSTYMQAVSAAIIASGAPVKGGAIDYCAQIIWHKDKDEPEIAAWRNSNIKKGDNFKVVRQSDHLAALASLQAEVGRLREYYEASVAINNVGILGATPEMYARERTARNALKGPEA